MNPRDLSNDNDPAFIAEFHKNVKILTQAFYQLTTSSSAIAPTSPTAIRLKTRESPPKTSLGHLLEPLRIDKPISSVTGTSDVQLSAASVPPIPPAYFDRASMQERLKRYAAEGGISLEALDRYLDDARGRGASSGTSSVTGLMTPILPNVRHRADSDAEEKTRNASIAQSPKGSDSENKEKKDIFERIRSLRAFMT